MIQGESNNARVVWFLFLIYALTLPIGGGMAWFAPARNSLDDVRAALFELVALAVGWCVARALASIVN